MNQLEDNNLWKIFEEALMFFENNGEATEKITLSKGEDRLRVIMMDFSKTVSYKEQLDEYLESVDCCKSHNFHDVKTFNIIVSNLVELGNIDLSKINPRENSMFEAYIDRLENQI